MYFTQVDISFQEVPNEISLIFSISGCPHKCPGCHSVDLWKKDFGIKLCVDLLQKNIQKYKGLVTCICFFGGEWEEQALISFLKEAQNEELKTCLYSGSDDVSSNIKEYLNYLKIGPWKKELGGLESKETNQKFLNVQTGESLNHYFHKNTHMEVADA